MHKRQGETMAQDSPALAPDAPTMTIPEAAAYLKIGRRQAYEAAQRGELPVLRIGKRILVSRKRLDELINGTAA